MVNKETLNFGNEEIEKQKFHSSKNLTNLNTADIDVMLLSNKFSYGKNNDFEYFIGSNIL